MEKTGPGLARFFIAVIWLIAAMTVFSFGVLLDKMPLLVGVALIALAMGLLVYYSSLQSSIKLLFYYLGFEGFFKIMSNYNPVIHIGADIFALILVLKSVSHWRTTPGSGQRKKPPFLPLFCMHIAWFFITFTNPYALSLVSSIAGAKVYLTMMTLFFFGYYFVNNAREIRSYFVPWLVVAALQIWTSIYQGMIGPQSVLHMHPRYAVLLEKLSGYAFRPFGLTSLPGGPSVYLYMIAPIALYFIFNSRSVLARVLIAVHLPFLALALMLCQVRSAILKALVGGASFLGYNSFLSLRASPQKFARQILIGACAIGVIAICTPTLMGWVTDKYSDNSRAIERSLSLFNYDKVKDAREGALDRFFIYAKMVPLGAGLSRTGAAAGKFQTLIDNDKFFPRSFFTDNTFLAVLVDLGLPGLIIFILLVLALLIRGAKIVWTEPDPEYKSIAIAISASLGAIVIGTYGAEAILYNPEAAYFWFFAGVLMRIPEMSPAQRQTDKPLHSPQPF